MTGKHERAAAEAAALEGRVHGELTNRYGRLDTLQNLPEGKDVTQSDLDFLNETQNVVQAFDVHAASFSEANHAYLASLKSLLESAQTVCEMRPLAQEEAVEGGEAKGRQKRTKKKDRIDRIVHEAESDLDGGVGRQAESGSTDRMWMEADFEGDADAQRWLGAMLPIEQMVVVAEGTGEYADLERAILALRDFIDDFYNPNVDYLTGAGQSLDAKPVLYVVGDKIDALKDRLESCENALQKKELAKDPNHREEVFERFSEKMYSLNRRVHELLALPLGTVEDVDYALEYFEALIKSMTQYGKDWESDVEPILKCGERWGPFAGLVKNRGEQIRAFYGKNAKGKKEGVESIQGVLQDFGRTLRNREKVVCAELWDDEFPAFSTHVAKQIVELQNARLFHGTARVERMNAIKAQVDELAEEWKTLRRGGPRLSPDEREAGQRSLVHRYNIIMRQLTRDMKAFARQAPRAPAADLRQPAFIWRDTLATTDVFWNDKMKFEARIDFLRAYADGSSNEEELARMVVPEERDNFIAVADGEVLERLRARGVQKLRKTETREQRRRAELSHPRLAMLRMMAHRTYTIAMRSECWKEETHPAQREALLFGAGELDDDALKDFVVDIGKFRMHTSSVRGTRKLVVDLENYMLEHGSPTGKVMRVEVLGNAMRRYLEAEQKAIRAWRSAKFCKEWSHPDIAFREQALRDQYNDFLAEGRKSFRHLPKENDRPVLRRAIIAWIDARRVLRIQFSYAQWLIDENPEFAAAMEHVPDEFVIPKIDEAHEDDDDTDEVVITEKDKASLTLPERSGSTSDEAGGDFGDAESAHEVSDQEDEDDAGAGDEDSGLGGERAPEDGGEGRKEAVEKGAPEIVKAFINQ